MREVRADRWALRGAELTQLVQLPRHLIFGGVKGWPGADAAYFAELACAGLPLPYKPFL